MRKYGPSVYVVIWASKLELPVSGDAVYELGPYPGAGVYLCPLRILMAIYGGCNELYEYTCIYMDMCVYLYIYIFMRTTAHALSS